MKLPRALQINVAANRLDHDGNTVRPLCKRRSAVELFDFVRRSVELYRTPIKVWDFLNEPNYTMYSLPD
jgi:hypothetical protein